MMLRTFGSRLVYLTIQLAFPPTCAGCGVSGAWLCKFCWREAIAIESERSCRRCGLPAEGSVDGCHRCYRWNDDLDAVRSAFVFDGPVRRAIHLAKFNGQADRNCWFGEELAPLLEQSGWEIDFITPVPLTANRLLERGYNQAGRIGAALAKEAEVEFREVVLKVRETEPQTSLSYAERLRNVAGAFESTEKLADQRILIVDDVVTTGATLLSCARALKDAGAGRVHGLTFATAIGEGRS